MICSDVLDNRITALEQKLQGVEVDVSNAESKAEEAEAEGDVEGLRHWRKEEL